MPNRDLIIDPATIDFDNVVADVEAIRSCNPQRDAMEQLTAIVCLDLDNQICVGYKDIMDDEFWVSGHMPGMPLMPGVIICEAAAQVCCYFAHRHNLLGEGVVGFGGLDAVRFRGMVRPGDRLVIASQILQIRSRRMITWRFQAFVDTNLVCEGEIRGIQLPIDSIKDVALE